MSPNSSALQQNNEMTTDIKMPSHHRPYTSTPDLLLPLFSTSIPDLLPPAFSVGISSVCIFAQSTSRHSIIPPPSRPTERIQYDLYFVANNKLQPGNNNINNKSIYSHPGDVCRLKIITLNGSMESRIHFFAFIQYETLFLLQRCFPSSPSCGAF